MYPNHFVLSIMEPKDTIAIIEAEDGSGRVEVP